MRWENIKKNKCPKCSKDFLESNVTMIGGMIKNRVVWHRECDFQITEDRYIQVLKERLTPELIQELEGDKIVL